MFKEYTKRIGFCVGGLLMCGLGNFFGVKAGVAGTTSWNTLSLGIVEKTGISFGTATFLISLVIILIDLVGRGKIGIGSILNTIIIAWSSDIYLRLFSFLPNAQSNLAGLPFALAGQCLVAFGSVIYMRSALGCGPRDTLMVLIGKKLPKFPIGLVRFCLEAGALCVGLLLGAPFGIGTVAVIVLQASVFQLACNISHCEPRSIPHEDVLDTLRRIRGSKVLSK